MSLMLLDGDRRQPVRLSPALAVPPHAVFERLPDPIDHRFIPPFLVVHIAAVADPHDMCDGGAVYTLQDSTLHLVVYLETLRLMCSVVDFTLLERIAVPYVNETLIVLDAAAPPAAAPAAKTPTLPAAPALAATGAATAVFDKVLLQRQLLNLYTVPPPRTTHQLSSQALTTHDQISHAVTKLVLSGLRLRGLSTTAASPDKVAVREIYRMTHKCAMFAVRKRNYTFNQPLTPLTLNEVQDIVERLLLVFIDT